MPEGLEFGTCQGESDEFVSQEGNTSKPQGTIKLGEIVKVFKCGTITCQHTKHDDRPKKGSQCLHIETPWRTYNIVGFETGEEVLQWLSQIRLALQIYRLKREARKWVKDNAHFRNTFDLEDEERSPAKKERKRHSKRSSHSDVESDSKEKRKSRKDKKTSSSSSSSTSSLHEKKDELKESKESTATEELKENEEEVVLENDQQDKEVEETKEPKEEPKEEEEGKLLFHFSLESTLSPLQLFENICEE